MKQAINQFSSETTANKMSEQSVEDKSKHHENKIKWYLSLNLASNHLAILPATIA